LDLHLQSRQSGREVIERADGVALVAVLAFEAGFGAGEDLLVESPVLLLRLRFERLPEWVRILGTDLAIDLSPRYRKSMPKLGRQIEQFQLKIQGCRWSNL
jgi:hypothetical protein